METQVKAPENTRKNVSEAIIDGKKVSEMTGTEILNWSEKLRNYLENNISEFDSPISLIRQGSISYRVVFDENRWFWDSVRTGSWEPETYAVFDKHLTADSVYFDIGAWIGPTVLYAAHLSKKAFAFEPDPVAFKELRKNVDLNQDNPAISQVEIFQEAVSVETGSIELGTKSDGGDSLSSVLLSDEDNSWKVPAISSKKMLEKAGDFDGKVFCKIDIEGFEYELLPNMQTLLQRPKTTLYISLHPQFLWNTIKTPSSWNVPGLLRSRLKFVRAHRKLLKSLKDFQIYYTNGRVFKSKTELAKSLITGSFPNGVVAVRS